MPTYIITCHSHGFSDLPPALRKQNTIIYVSEFVKCQDAILTPIDISVKIHIK